MSNKHCLQHVLAVVARTQHSICIKRTGSREVTELTPLTAPLIRSYLLIGIRKAQGGYYS